MDTKGWCDESTALEFAMNEKANKQINKRKHGSSWRAGIVGMECERRAVCSPYDFGVLKSDSYSFFAGIRSCARAVGAGIVVWPRTQGPKIHHCYLLIVMHSQFTTLIECVCVCVQIRICSCVKRTMCRSILSWWACMHLIARICQIGKTNQQRSWENESKATTVFASKSTNEPSNQWVHACTAKCNGYSILESLVYAYHIQSKWAPRASWHNMIQRIPLCCVLHSIQLNIMRWLFMMMLMLLPLLLHFSSSHLPYRSVRQLRAKRGKERQAETRNKTTTKSSKKKQNK